MRLPSTHADARSFRTCMPGVSNFLVCMGSRIAPVLAQSVCWREQRMRWWEL